MTYTMFPGSYRIPTFFPETRECRRCGVARNVSDFRETPTEGKRRVCRLCLNAAKRERRAAKKTCTI